MVNARSRCVAQLRSFFVHNSLHVVVVVVGKTSRTECNHTQSERLSLARSSENIP